MKPFHAALCAAFLLIAACAGAPVDRRAAGQQRRAEASRLLAGGDFAGAARVLQPLVSDNPRDAQLLSMLGEAYWRQGEYAAATAQFEASLRIEYSAYRTHMLLAQMLMEQGKTGRALTEFELAAQLGTHQALPHYNYGLALYKLGRTEDALQEWRLAYQLESGNPDYAAALGMAFTGIDDGEALTYFEKAAALGKEDPQFLHNFGVLLERLGEYGRAERQFQRALEQSPADRDYAFSLAALYMKRSDYDRALPLLDELAAAEPAKRLYRIYQAKADLELGRFGEAIAALEQVAIDWEAEATPLKKRAEAGPPLDQAFDIVAMAYRGLGDPEKSLIYIEKAVALAPASTAHLINYGVILAENGKIEQAVAQWERVLEIDPANETARRNLAAHKKR